MIADPEYGAMALIALMDKEADEGLRFDGAMLVAGIARDLGILRRAYTKTNGG